MVKHFKKSSKKKMAFIIEPKVLQCVYKLCPCGDLDLFYDKVSIGRQCISMGKTLKRSFEVKMLQEMGSRTEY